MFQISFTLSGGRSYKWFFNDEADLIKHMEFILLDCDLSGLIVIHRISY